MCCSEKLEKIKWEFLLQKLRQKNPIFQINDSSVQFHRWRAIEQKCPCKNRILRDIWDTFILVEPTLIPFQLFKKSLLKLGTSTYSQLLKIIFDF